MMNINNKPIPSSEMPINSDGSVFHLHLKPEHLADHIILVGDRERVNLVAKFFDEGSIECDISSREFHTITGSYKGNRVTCLSHGIGIGNIDIVMTELDALANIDLETRIPYEDFRQLTMVRIGTSGGLQPECPVGSYVISKRSIGFDGLLNYYRIPDGVIDMDFEYHFCTDVKWNNRLPRPYVVSADEELVEKIGFDMVKGVTISAPGFYGPQGRQLRLSPVDPTLNAKIEKFEYNGEKITNYEMESSGVAGMARMFGHKATTVCDIIAGRVDKSMNTQYHGSMEKLIETVLDRMF